MYIHSFMENMIPVNLTQEQNIDIIDSDDDDEDYDIRLGINPQNLLINTPRQIHTIPTFSNTRIPSPILIPRPSCIPRQTNRPLEETLSKSR